MLPNNILTQEQRIVILASRLTFSEDDEKELTKLAKEKLDWFQVFKIALKNQVIQLIWNNLKVRNLEQNIPNRLRYVFLFYTSGTKERNLIIFHELMQIMKAIQPENNQCVIVKGGYLIPHVYKDFGIRTVSDIDFLIPVAQVKQLRAIMNSLGYIEGDYDSVTNTIKPPNREREVFYTISMHQTIPFRKIINSSFIKYITFDVNFLFDHYIKPELVNLVISRAEVSQDGYYRYLKSSDFFIHQCCHHYKDAFSAAAIFINSNLNIVKYCDLREYILQHMNESQLYEAIEFAKENGLEKPVYFTLYCLEQIYNDGYEKKLLQALNIKDNEFINKFGKNEYGYEITWKKNFWQRLFSESNIDELPYEPKQAKVMNLSTK